MAYHPQLRSDLADSRAGPASFHPSAQVAALPGTEFCDRCAQKVEPLPHAICERCGRPQPSPSPCVRPVAAAIVTLDLFARRGLAHRPAARGDPRAEVSGSAANWRGRSVAIWSPHSQQEPWLSLHRGHRRSSAGSRCMRNARSERGYNQSRAARREPLRCLWSGAAAGLVGCVRVPRANRLASPRRAQAERGRALSRPSRPSKERRCWSSMTCTPRALRWRRAQRPPWTLAHGRSMPYAGHTGAS